MVERRRLLVALMFRGSDAASVDGLRIALGSSEVGRLAPHITLVPPRNVREDELVAALTTLRGAAASGGPVRVVLKAPRTFTPDGRVLYLEVDGEIEMLERLADLCSSGAFRPPSGRSERDFVAHVTVANRAEPAVVDAARIALGDFHLPVEFLELSLLEQDETAPTRPWREIAAFVLERRPSTGRGGLEIEIEHSRIADPEVRAFVAGHEGGGGRLADVDSLPGEAFALACRIEGKLVGVALGATFGSEATLLVHLVDTSQRTIGIGTRLLNAAEQRVSERGCLEMRLALDEGSASAHYYAGRGFIVREPAFVRGPRCLVHRIGRV